MGDEAAKEGCRAALKSAAGFIRHQLAGQLNLRLTPEITYIMDDSIEYAISMSKKIDDLMEKERSEEEK